MYCITQILLISRSFTYELVVHLLYDTLPATYVILSGMTHLRIYAFLATCLWLTISVFVWSNIGLSEALPIKIISTITTVAFAIYSIYGASTFTSIAGKALITINILSFVTLLLYGELHIASSSTLLHTFSLMSGLLIERMSPHQQLYSWMFLMIATKVEVLLIAVFILRSADVAVSSPFTEIYWWVIIPLMLSGVISLARKNRTLYRILIMCTSCYAVILVALYIANTPFTIASTLAIVVALWPIITERLIGYRSFAK